MLIINAIYRSALDNDLLWITKFITTRDKYSEDIDLVQVKSEPFGLIIDKKVKKEILEKL